MSNSRTPAPLPSLGYDMRRPEYPGPIPAQPVAHRVNRTAVAIVATLSAAFVLLALIGALLPSQASGATQVQPAAAHAAHGQHGTLKRCRYEDGPGPCVWDARHMGNGKGRSFRVTRSGKVVYITHRRAHRLAYGKAHHSRPHAVRGWAFSRSYGFRVTFDNGSVWRYTPCREGRTERDGCALRLQRGRAAIMLHGSRYVLGG